MRDIRVNSIVKTEYLDNDFQEDQYFYLQVIAIQEMKDEYIYYVNAPENLKPYDSDGELIESCFFTFR